VPVLFLENLDNNKALAQIIASSDPRFRETLFDKVSGKPYLNEVFIFTRQDHRKYLPG